ncbi:MAG TPA: hypothetical protein VKC53_03340 [Patescibacteria group bacterium]|nr:hypothetical protein [Patescibacteria group bacterium]
MHELTEKYSVNPNNISLDNVPTVYNSKLDSGAPLNNDFNKAQIKHYLNESKLSESERKYIAELCLKFGKVVNNLGNARKILTSDDPEKSFPTLFRGEPDRKVDINILKKLLAPNKWGIGVGFVTFSD